MSEIGEGSMDEDGFERANQRYHNDVTFHIRVTLAERATIRRLEAEGMVLTARSYRVAIRMAAMLGVVAAETVPDRVRPCGKDCQCEVGCERDTEHDDALCRDCQASGCEPRP